MAKQMCALCGCNPATTKDHLPPKSIYPKDVRAGMNLHTVPSCSDCNNNAALDDEEFKIAMGFLTGEYRKEQSERQPNVWYDLAPKYQGPTSVIFNDSGDTVQGSGVSEFGATRGSVIDFHCVAAEAQRLEQKTWRGQEGVMDSRGPEPPTKITICAPNGDYTADFRIGWNSIASNLSSNSSKVQFSAIGGTFISRNSQSADHFVLPLFNMLSPAFEMSPRPQHPLVDNHPLRIFPTPAAVKATETDEERLSRNWHNRIITFAIDGKPGFIEPLPDYQERVRRLRDGESLREITALLVCDAITHKVVVADVGTWFPIDILALLSLATGHRVGAPWLEYRISDAQLVNRIHVSFGAPEFDRGHALVAEERSPNTGHLLTEGFKSTYRSTSTFHLAASHLYDAGVQPQTIDDRFLCLSRAFEAIAKENSLSTQDLKAQLGVTESAAVTAELHKCGTLLNQFATTVSDPNQANAINRIADKVRASDQRDKRFGDAVSEVSSKFGLFDATVLLHGFTALDGSNWPSLLSFFRGCLVHEGGFNLLTGQIDIKEVVRVTNHLHDLLARIVLKSLGYQPSYASPIFPRGILRELNWVTQTTSAAELIVPN